MKTSIYIGFVVGVILVASLLTWSFQEEEIQTTENISLSCLEDYANDYCEKGDYAIDVNFNDFRCMLKPGHRINYNEVSRKFYFLDREIRSCTIQQLNSNGGK